MKTVGVATRRPSECTKEEGPLRVALAAVPLTFSREFSRGPTFGSS
jgi:hypothetical protein